MNPWNAGVGRFTMVSFRLHCEHAMIITRAARLSGMKRSEFLRKVALEAAECVIAEELKHDERT
ncbi:DUF1778 domain-containing protein [Bradyrhizobium sp. 150]|uniref:type II toxin -antitoxin system TacA 1-like antitoxin n=1 Tax=Bradyrhizobium sp. 150 TaxID=2782625 RepID=UPI001FFAA7DC|nr:DUF1778 domain-containing protein [Bradyrhizobium sp. 150]MCK1671041.1 DUF1778 domain-containing protein [Bradyrhizobium sp. 150]